MSNNPFDRNKTKEAKLGQLITKPGEQNQRDAVHIAVVPMLAVCDLYAAQPIGVNEDGTNADPHAPHVGIVDPFLTAKVKPGETFWLFLFQGSVTTLRHEWTHPAFPVIPHADIKPAGGKEESISWLRQYAKRVNNYLADDGDKAYETLMEGIRSGELTYHGTDMHGLGDLQDADELQRHAQIVLGRPVDWGQFEYFSCSC